MKFKRGLISIFATLTALCCTVGLSACDLSAIISGLNGGHGSSSSSSQDNSSSSSSSSSSQDNSSSSSSSSSSQGNSSSSSSSSSSQGNSSSSSSSSSSTTVTPAESVGLAFTLTGDTYALTGLGTCQDAQIVIPATYEDKAVTAITENAFKNGSAITSVSIPASVTEIAVTAFRNTAKLAEITVDESNTVYKSVDGNLYTKDGKTLVRYATGDAQTAFEIPDGVTAIGADAFYCTSLQTVTIPASVTEMGDLAFSTSSSLKNVYFEGTLTQWCSVTFGGVKANPLYGGKANLYIQNEKLTEFTMPDGITALNDYVFAGCASITSATLCADVEGIGEYAFYQCDNLSSITVGADITTISRYAFGSCKKLTTVDYESQTARATGSGLKTIGQYAFTNCSALTSITIPASVQEIQKGAFEVCSKLEQLHVEDLTAWCNINFEHTSANPMACGVDFYLGDTLVTALEIPQGVTEIKKYAFYGSRFTSITLSTGVMQISQYAFAKSAALTELTIPEGITEIPHYAFSDCTNLERVFLPSTVSNITKYTFQNCQKLKIYYKGNATDKAAITLPDGFTEVWYYYVDGADNVPDDGGSYWYYGENNSVVVDSPSLGLQYTLLDNGTYAVSGAGTCTETVLIVPSTYKGVPVTEIGRGAFSLQSTFTNKLTSVQLPSSIVAINYDAFAACYNMTSIYIPVSVKSIGSEAMPRRGAKSAKFESIYYEGTLSEWAKIQLEKNYIYNNYYYETKIDIYFNGEKATDVTVTPTDMANACEMTFYGWKSLETFNFTGTIGEWCGISFANSKANPLLLGAKLLLNGVLVEDLVIDSTATKVGDYAFVGCDQLKSVVISGNVESIGKSAFDECSNLTSVTIENGVKSISEYAFESCVSLQEIVLPNSVTDLGGYAFAYCSGLTSVTLSSGMKTIEDSAFYHCYLLENVVIPEGIETIGSSAFYIDGFDFRNEAMTSIVIPNSVTSIGSYAFYGYSRLQNITLGSGVKEVGSGAFDGRDGVSLCKNVYYQGTLEQWCQIEFEGGESNPLFTRGYCQMANLYIGGALLTDLVIPATITEIDEYAFVFATCIRSVTLPSTLQKVGANAFLFAGVEKLTIAEGVTHLGESAFRGCPIKTVTVPSSLQTAETYALWSSSLVELINNSSVDFTDIVSKSTKIYTGESKLVKQGDYLFATFDGVNYLVGYEGTQKNITLPELYNGQTYEIYRYAFYEKDLRSVNIGGGVTKIGEGAFSSCLGLSVLVIGDNVTEIGESAFYDCSLASITLGKSVTKIGTRAFNATNGKLVELINLSSLDIAYSNYVHWESKYGDLPYPTVLHNGASVLVNQDGFLFVSKNTNREICSFAKADYHTLVAYVGEATAIMLPESYNGAEYRLEAHCFRGASFTEIVVPDGVTHIFSRAFRDCQYLQSVVISKEVDAIESYYLISYNYEFVATIVYYEGTKEEWVTACGEETPPESYTVAFYSQTEPTTDGNYWYYDENNKPVLW